MLRQSPFGATEARSEALSPERFEKWHEWLDYYDDGSSESEYSRRHLWVSVIKSWSKFLVYFSLICDLFINDEDKNVMWRPHVITVTSAIQVSMVISIFLALMHTTAYAAGDHGQGAGVCMGTIPKVRVPLSVDLV